MPSFAFVTPSYSLDYEYCRLLSSSINKHTPDSIPHYIIVPKIDKKLFSTLKTNRTHILIQDDFLPTWMFKIPFQTKWYFSLRTPPIRGWIRQQLIKLSAHKFLQEDVLIYIDSDTFFIKDFDPTSLVKNGNVPLVCKPNFNKKLDKWRKVSNKLLNLSLESERCPNYIDQLVFWRRENIQKLNNYIESKSILTWWERLCWQISISEYILYGVFTDHVLGNKSGHYHDSTKRVGHYWGTKPLGEKELVSLKNDIKPGEVAVMVSAKSFTSPALIKRVFNL